MPISSVVRRLRGQWSVVEARAGSIRPSIPSEGIDRAAYVDRALFDIDPAYVDEALRLLHHRGLAWVRRSRGSIRVYPVRPKSITVEPGAGLTAKGRMLSAIAPHMLGLAGAEEARRTLRTAEAWEAEARAAETVALACGRVLTILRAHAARGLALAEMRQAIAATFHPHAVEALQRREPRLTNEAKAERFDEEITKPKSKRIANGMSADEKAFALIEASGRKGITRTTIQRRIRPLMKANDIDLIALRLEDAGAIVSATVRMQSIGRPGLRYYSASIGAPTIGPDKIAIFPAE